MLFSPLCRVILSVFFFFNDTATTEIYTLSLHDALPISPARPARGWSARRETASHRRLARCVLRSPPRLQDRKSTRLNSSHGYISYAVFCLKKKKKQFSRFPAVLLCFPAMLRTCMTYR